MRPRLLILITALGMLTGCVMTITLEGREVQLPTDSPPMSATPEDPTPTRETATWTPTLTPTVAASLPRVRVTGSVVNVRTCRDTALCAVIATVERDEVYRYDEAEGGWYHIRLDDLRAGWIAGWLVEEIE